jgi:hypothetical protein
VRSHETISLGWCDPGTTDGEFTVAGMMLAAARTARLGPVIRVEGACLISKLRNQIASTFLDRSTAEWLLMLDADEVLSVPAFDALLAAADADERPIVAGLYFGAFDTGDAYPTPMPMIFRRDESGGYQPVRDYPAGDVIEVDAAGTGCLLIHRRVLEAMRERHTVDEGPDFCWFIDGPVQGQWVGEDIAFCMRAAMQGYPIHAATAATLPHRKRYWLTEGHHDLLMASQAKG